MRAMILTGTLAVVGLAMMSIPASPECLYNCDDNPPCEVDAGCLGPCVCDYGMCVHD